MRGVLIAVILSIILTPVYSIIWGKIEIKIEIVGLIPSRTILEIQTDACPSGWSEYKRGIQQNIFANKKGTTFCIKN